MSDFKICTKCNIEKDIKCFEFRSDTNKYRNYCKKCNKQFTKEYVNSLCKVKGVIDIFY